MNENLKISKDLWHCTMLTYHCLPQYSEHHPSLLSPDPPLAYRRFFKITIITFILGKKLLLATMPSSMRGYLKAGKSTLNKVFIRAHYRQVKASECKIIILIYLRISGPNISIPPIFPFISLKFHTFISLKSHTCIFNWFAPSARILNWNEATV